MLDRTKAPETYEIDAVNLQVAQTTTFKNGARLHIIKSETQPVVRLDFVFNAGKWFEHMQGVSDLTAKMLFEGTKNLTANQIAEKVAYYGASFDNNHGYDRSDFTLYCLSKYVQELLPLVLDVLQNPIFPEEEFKLLRKRTAQNVKVQRQKNSYLATHSFTQAIYGEHHPYIFGFANDVIENIELQHLKDFYQNNYSTEGLEVFACGAVTDADLAQLTAGIEQLTLTGKPTPSKEAKQVDIPTAERFVDMPDSLQSSIRVGSSFPLIGHEDYFKLLLLNEVFGGYFGSRLMRNIREDKGYTYGIYSAISPKERDTLFFIGTDVNYAVTTDTLNEIKKEIKLLQDEEISEDELQTVKNYMVGKFINDVSTIFEQCDRYKRIVLHQLPLEHYNNYIKAVRATTAPELQELAQKYFDTHKMITAIAGKRESEGSL